MKQHSTVVCYRLKALNFVLILRGKAIKSKVPFFFKHCIRRNYRINLKFLKIFLAVFYLNQIFDLLIFVRRLPLTYKVSGVNIDAGEKLVQCIKPLVAGTRTKRSGVVGDIGSFGGLFRLNEVRNLISHKSLLSDTNELT